MGSMLNKSIFYITSVNIEKLFGFLTYYIEPFMSPHLMILYGDNGCGKTTILNLLIHTLSPEDSKGHKTYIARIPFKRFGISFDNGYSVKVERNEARSGPYRISVAKDGKEIVSHNMVVDKSGSVRQQDAKTYPSLLNALQDLNIGLYFIPDNRKIMAL